MNVAPRSVRLPEPLGSWWQNRRPQGRPWVTLSYAQSLDGCLTRRRGAPTPLSGPASLRLTHRLRAAHDGILVGIGTVLADDPRLTTRLVAGPQPQPVVLDSHLRLPPTARVLDHPRSVWVATTSRAPQAARRAVEARGAQVLVFSPNEAGQVPLAPLLAALADRGLRTLMVEGGARVLTAFLQAGLADAVVVTVAPVYLSGLPAIEGRLPQPIRPSAVHWELYGEDAVLWALLP